MGGVASHRIRSPAILLAMRDAVRFILFDAVGTLIHVRPSVAEVYHQVAQAHGSRRTVDEIRQRFAEMWLRHHDEGPTDEERERLRWQRIVAEVLDDLAGAGEAPFEELWRRFSQGEQWALFPDVATTLEALSGRGYTLGIASNFDARLLSVCRALPPLDQVPHYFISSQLGFPKPHREFFRGIERLLGASPPELLLVGDSAVHDLAGAHRAGWQAIHLERERPAAAGGSITSLTELLDLL